MEKLSIFILYILTSLELLSFCYIILHKKYNGFIWKRGIVLVLLFFLLVYGVGMNWEKHLLYLIVQIFLVFLIYFIFSISLIEAFKIWIITFLLFALLEVSVDYIMTAFSIFPHAHQMEKEIICMIVVIVVLWIYYLVIGRKLDRDIFQLTKRVWLVIVAVMFIVVLMVSYFVFILAERQIAMVKAGAVLIMLGGMAICGLVMALIYYFNGTEKYRIQNEIAEQFNGQQKEYFERLLETEKDTRQFRHDMANHLIAMSGLCEREDYIHLENYIQDLLGELNTINHAQYDVGNEIVNTIMNYYFIPIMDKCHITVRGYMGGIDSILQKDMCIVVSNLIKNAVEAVNYIEENKQKQILVQVNKGEKYLCLKVENTIGCNVTIAQNGLPETIKEDTRNHGFGILNAMQVVERYEGNYRGRVENGMYIAEIYLKL